MNKLVRILFFFAFFSFSFLKYPDHVLAAQSCAVVGRGEIRISSNLPSSLEDGNPGVSPVQISVTGTSTALNSNSYYLEAFHARGILPSQSISQTASRSFADGLDWTFNSTHPWWQNPNDSQSDMYILLRDGSGFECEVTNYTISAPGQSSGLNPICGTCTNSSDCEAGLACEQGRCIEPPPFNAGDGAACLGTRDINNCGDGFVCDGSYLGFNGIQRMCDEFNAGAFASIYDVIDNQCTPFRTTQNFDCLERDGQCSSDVLTSVNYSCADGLTFNECQTQNGCWINGNGNNESFNNTTNGSCVTSVASRQCGTAGNACCPRPAGEVVIIPGSPPQELLDAQFLDCTSGTKSARSFAGGAIIDCYCEGAELGDRCTNDEDCLSGNCGPGGFCSFSGASNCVESVGEAACENAGGFFCGGGFCCNASGTCPGETNLPSYNLCEQIPNQTAKTSCETCFDNDGIWTAVGCISTRPSQTIAAIIQIGLTIGGGITILVILAGGFLFTTSQGEAQKVSDAKEMIQGAVIGLLFIIFSITILQFIGSTLLNIPGFGG